MSPNVMRTVSTVFIPKPLKRFKGSMTLLTTWLKPGTNEVGWIIYGLNDHRDYRGYRRAFSLPVGGAQDVSPRHEVGLSRNHRPGFAGGGRNGLVAGLVYLGTKD
jgi:hypothetical protein